MYTYTVFTSNKKILFSYKGSYGYEERLNTAKEIFFCEKNDFTKAQKSIEEMYRMIEAGVAFFPINEGTKASDIRNYIEAGFKVAFLRAGDFKKFKKDYRDFI